MALPKHTKRLTSRDWRKRSNIRKNLFRKWRDLNVMGEVSEGMDEQIKNFMVRTYRKKNGTT